MGHNNQYFHLFQRKFLIGLYESSSRKTQKTRMNTILIKFLRRQSFSQRCSRCERSMRICYQIIEYNFDYYIVRSQILTDSDPLIIHAQVMFSFRCVAHKIIVQIPAILYIFSPINRVPIDNLIRALKSEHLIYWINQK